MEQRLVDGDGREETVPEISHGGAEEGLAAVPAPSVLPFLTGER
jgi:hypothetical protein